MKQKTPVVKIRKDFRCCTGILSNWGGGFVTRGSSML